MREKLAKRCGFPVKEHERGAPGASGGSTLRAVLQLTEKFEAKKLSAEFKMSQK